MAADRALLGQVILYRVLEGCFGELGAVEMGVRQLADLVHNRDHRDGPKFSQCSISGEHPGCLNAGFTVGAAVGPGRCVADPAIPELESNLHGVTAIAGNSRRGIRVFELFVGEIMQAEPGEDQDKENEQGNGNIDDFHGLGKKLREMNGVGLPQRDLGHNIFFGGLREEKRHDSDRIFKRIANRHSSHGRFAGSMSLRCLRSRLRNWS